MDELEQRLKQCKRPTGAEGKEIAAEMNESHYELTGWGLSKIAIPAAGKFLDIGCGGGRTLYRLAEAAPAGEFFGIDYSPDCVAWSQEYNERWIEAGRMKVLHGSVEALPFADSQFDLITAVETVYFWPGLEKCCREVHRVLKPSGSFVIITASYEDESFAEVNERFTQSGDMKIFAPEELKDMLQRAGFSRTAVHTDKERNWLCCVSQK